MEKLISEIRNERIKHLRKLKTDVKTRTDSLEQLKFKKGSMSKAEMSERAKMLEACEKLVKCIHETFEKNCSELNNFWRSRQPSSASYASLSKDDVAAQAFKSDVLFVEHFFFEDEPDTWLIGTLFKTNWFLSDAEKTYIR